MMLTRKQFDKQMTPELLEKLDISALDTSQVLYMNNKKGPQRCVLCLRSKEEAIKEQVDKGVGCGNSKCIFAETIQQAIKDSQNTKESRYCIECGYAFHEGDRFCINCGTERIK